MVISCKPSEYRVNDRIYNFLSIFLLNSAIAIFILIFFKYIHKVVFLPKKINFKVQTFCEISTFRFWLPVFLSCRLQNARNAVSENQIPPPPPPPLHKESCAFGLVWSIYLLDGISPLKKKPGYGPGDGKSEEHTE